jgi:hypothetical protein
MNQQLSRHELKLHKHGRVAPLGQIYEKLHKEEVYNIMELQRQTKMPSAAAVLVLSAFFAYSRSNILYGENTSNY